MDRSLVDESSAEAALAATRETEVGDAVGARRLLPRAIL